MADLHLIVAVVAGSGGVLAALWHHTAGRRRPGTTDRSRKRAGHQSS